MEILNYPETTFEKLPVTIFQEANEGAVNAAHEIANIIRSRQKEGRNAVLGLATGSTPIGLYAELVRMHKEEGLSFKNVITFNLDEYYPLEKDAYQSYHSFMHQHLFSLVDMDPANIHIPDGEWPKEEIKKYCLDLSPKVNFFNSGGISFIAF